MRLLVFVLLLVFIVIVPFCIGGSIVTLVMQLTGMFGLAVSLPRF